MVHELVLNEVVRTVAIHQQYDLMVANGPHELECLRSDVTSQGVETYLGRVWVNRVGFGLRVALLYMRRKGVLLLRDEEKNPRGASMVSMVFLITIKI